MPDSRFNSPLPQTQALEEVREQVAKIDEAYQGYRDDLMKTLYIILELESDPPHNIAQRATRAVEATVEIFNERQKEDSP